MKKGETLEDAFSRAKKTGFANDPNDRGGATMVGVTISTYRQYC
jgi:lysozyme family protein